MANQICDEMTPAAAADQSQTPDDVAMATTEGFPATPEVSAPDPVSVEEQPSSEAPHLTTLRENIVGENGVVITPEEMDLAQLKVQVVCQEKANMALRMELKCAELQVTETFSIIFLCFWCTFLSRCQSGFLHQCQ